MSLKTVRPKPQARGFSYSIPSRAPNDCDDASEDSPLIHDEPDEDGCLHPTSSSHRHEPCPPDPHAGLPVYQNIHRVRRDIIAAVEDPYTMEQLSSPRMNIHTVRPLVDKLYDMHDISIIYCLLVNRTQFLREQNGRSHQYSVNSTRAGLCEVVAIKIIRRLNERYTGKEGLLLLANVLVGGFEPFQNAPDETIKEHRTGLHWATQKRGGYERKLTALEVAIISESKAFLAAPACQKVVDAIYRGRLVYTPTTFFDILPDHYKHKPISIYDPRKAPLLNHYRLIVPRTRNFLEILQFITLLALFILVMETKQISYMTVYEIVFCVFAIGYALDEVASILEHGWQVYTQNLWSFLDVTFIFIFFTYFVTRVQGLSEGNDEVAYLALNILSTGAVALLPRLAFNLMSENMLFISLRAMMSDFMLLMFLAVWCFAGFLMSMRWLDELEVHSAVTISKWMIWIWFGLDGTGIQEAPQFHWLLGPVLMVAFACLANTLLLTILVSMLSNTFSKIANNVGAEVQFRRAVLVFEGVKSDAIFAYQPPFNIGAIIIMLPLKFFVSPRWFHKINVCVIRVLNAPMLLCISLYERETLWRQNAKSQSWLTQKLESFQVWRSNYFTVHGDLQAVFEAEPPEEAYDNYSDIAMLEDHADQSKQHEGGHADDEDRERHQRRLSNADSLVPQGLSGHLSHLIGAIQGEREIKGAPERLERVEAAVQRMEKLLAKIASNYDDGDDNDNEEESPNAPD
ncbi:uncharacterized protein L969DRAFT_19510 [Mixia osmundae IAM 14324]|uniref:Ion transport domain-containing protein n=1 Tax=Mixia osmundae (strain CBS 9802 / IAM 14324 / JCM 22182 / KY 12970) TaxID=764103 RepID=G7DUR6_MIXOS|nr:uncharacterized protein L969DRAFT_19510 [Mixia osmundae IAM 14324]KEI37458.1 hypothetical protein L969DRAFT_19510 [Mixia osmundae IAM 14324]GAA94326.1 hypothetical protein E5Q_00976 [Mixia osmundae IAM 14324]